MITAAREMGRDPDREPPFFFMKPADTVVDTGTTVPYPPQTKNFHYEIELIVAVGQGGTDMPVDRALDHIWGYGVGIDLTRRDLQLQAREHSANESLVVLATSEFPSGPNGQLLNVHI